MLPQSILLLDNLWCILHLNFDHLLLCTLMVEDELLDFSIEIPLNPFLLSIRYVLNKAILPVNVIIILMSSIKISNLASLNLKPWLLLNFHLMRMIGIPTQEPPVTLPMMVTIFIFPWTTMKARIIFRCPIV